MAAILENVIVPDGDLVLVLTSSFVLEERSRLLEARAREAVGRELQDERNPACVPPSPDPELPPPEALYPGGDIRIRVRAQTLRDVSRPFSIFLREDGVHGYQLKQNGWVELDLEDDDDPQAFCFLLNHIFRRDEEVPGSFSDIQLDFETLVEACVLIDKYDLHRATRFLVKDWWPLFQGNMPREAHGFDAIKARTDLREWICITWVLKKYPEMEELIKLFKFYSTGFRGDGSLLPLPDRLLEADGQRRYAITEFNRLLENYRQSSIQWRPQAICNCNCLQTARECDGKTVDALERSLARANLLDPNRRVDPSRVCFHILRNHISRMRLPHTCQVKARELSNAKAHADLSAQAGLSSQISFLDDIIVRDAIANDPWLQSWPDVPYGDGSPGLLTAPSYAPVDPSPLLPGLSSLVTGQPASARAAGGKVTNSRKRKAPCTAAAKPANRTYNAPIHPMPLQATHMDVDSSNEPASALLNPSNPTLPSFGLPILQQSGGMPQAGSQSNIQGTGSDDWLVDFNFPSFDPAYPAPITPCSPKPGVHVNRRMADFAEQLMSSRRVNTIVLD